MRVKMREFDVMRNRYNVNGFKYEINQFDEWMLFRDLGMYEADNSNLPITPVGNDNGN
jgi:hypothetical protein